VDTLVQKQIQSALDTRKSSHQDDLSRQIESQKKMEASSMSVMQRSFDDYKLQVDEMNKTVGEKDSKISKLN